MKFRIVRSTSEHKQKWHKWFAWHPVIVNGTFIWLEYVYRKSYYHTGYAPGWNFEYRVEGQM
jgi:hypothetical protein